MNRGMRRRWASTFCSTPWRTSRLCLWLVLALPAHAATVPDLWPLQPIPATWSNQLATAQAVPAELQPALQFQKTFGAILAGTTATVWRADLEKSARLTGTDPVTQGVRDAARTWLARVWMQDLDGVLREYYRHHVSFPDKLGDVPESLRTDPWGQPWVYSLREPTGFKRQTNQRYQLGPTRNPQLSSLRDAIKKRRPPAATWKITPQDVAGARALRFQSTTANALIQPGGTVDGFLLMYVGDGWALFGGPDQLFTVTF